MEQEGSCGPRGSVRADRVPPFDSKLAPLDATSAVSFTEQYLLTFDDELKKAKEPDELIKAMQQKFPSSDLLLAIERGAKANIKHQ
jgi:hypothetical protein